MANDEKVVNIVSFDKAIKDNYMIFTTKNGLIKKTEMSEYNIKKGKGVLAIKLKEGDEG